MALFADLQFRQGFLLSYPDSSKGRLVEAVLQLDDVNNVPVWRLCQWGTKHSLAGAPCVRSGHGDFCYENPAKTVIVGEPNSLNRTCLELKGKPSTVQGSEEHGSLPHLLAEQDAIHLYCLDELSQIQFDISLRLLQCTSHMTNDQFDPSFTPNSNCSALSEHQCRIRRVVVITGSVCRSTTADTTYRQPIWPKMQARMVPQAGSFILWMGRRRA